MNRLFYSDEIEADHWKDKYFVGRIISHEILSIFECRDLILHDELASKMKELSDVVRAFNQVEYFRRFSLDFSWQSDHILSQVEYIWEIFNTAKERRDIRERLTEEYRMLKIFVVTHAILGKEIIILNKIPLFDYIEPDENDNKTIREFVPYIDRYSGIIDRANIFMAGMIITNVIVSRSVHDYYEIDRLINRIESYVVENGNEAVNKYINMKWVCNYLRINCNNIFGFVNKYSRSEMINRLDFLETVVSRTWISASVLNNEAILMIKKYSIELNKNLK